MKLLQDCFRAELKKELDQIKKKNPRYSLRAMSRSLNLSSGTLSDFLNKKRSFSFAKVEKILATTELLLSKTRDLVQRLKESGHLKPDAMFDFYPVHDRVGIDELEGSMIPSWHNFALLSLAETHDFKTDIAWVSRRLGMKPELVEEGLKCLLRLKLVEGGRIGELKPTGKSYAVGPGVSSQTVKKTQTENLDLARHSLESDPATLRDFYSITMAIDPAKLDEAKRRTRIFMDSLSDLLETGERSEVYQAQLQLFPLSRR